MVPNLGGATLVAVWLGLLHQGRVDGGLVVRLSGGPPSAYAAARLALERRGARIFVADDGAEHGEASEYRYSAATGLYRLATPRPDGVADADLPAWVGGASTSYEAVAALKGLGFLDVPESDSERDAFAQREEHRYDAAWGKTATDEPEGVRCSALGYDLSPMPRAELEAAAAGLPDVARAVLLGGGTERPNSHNEWPHGEGLYRCAVGGLPLFSSSAREPSSTGWLSFSEPVDEGHVLLRADWSSGLERTEVLCARSRCHLGHVFSEAGGRRRFCINGAALRFDAARAADERAHPAAAHRRELVLAGGCFWGLQHTFLCMAGALEVEAGYARLEPARGAAASGTTPAAAARLRSVAAWAVEPALAESGLSYAAVRAGGSGWVEAVRIVFNCETAPTPQLLDHFFRSHDASVSPAEPWPANYASAILIPPATAAAHAAELRTAAAESMARAQMLLRAAGEAHAASASAPPPELATVLGGAEDGVRVRFARAEEAQQRYLAKRGKAIVVRRLPLASSTATADGGVCLEAIK